MRDSTVNLRIETKLEEIPKLGCSLLRPRDLYFKRVKLGGTLMLKCIHFMDKISKRGSFQKCGGGGVSQQSPCGAMEWYHGDQPRMVAMRRLHGDHSWLIVMIPPHGDHLH